MRIILTQIGKTEDNYLLEGIQLYEKRINNYLPFEIKTIPYVKFMKNMDINVIKLKEADLLLSKMDINNDIIVLLDEQGKEMSSLNFANFLQKNMLNSTKVLHFVIGGPYGFADIIRQKANHIISLSKMTFSHQLVRLIFTEQLYRAMTIIKGEPYHH
jgi:23S rRNA (pseudouridine1915-N3)-methyltransferase